MINADKYFDLLNFSIDIYYSLIYFLLFHTYLFDISDNVRNLIFNL